MNSPPARSYPKRGQRTTASYSGRRQRRSAGAPSRHPVLERSSGVAQKWTRVLRNPTSPHGEPYFGSGPTATFQIPMWVRISDLTEEEKLKYEEAERKKEEKRAAWKKAVERRQFSEADTTVDDVNDGEETKDEGVKESNHHQKISHNDEVVFTYRSADDANLQNNVDPECIDEFYKREREALSSPESTNLTAMDSRKLAEDVQDASLTKGPSTSEPCESVSDETPMEVERHENENNADPQNQQHEMNLGHPLSSSIVKEDTAQMTGREDESPSQQQSIHDGIAIQDIDETHPLHKQRYDVIGDRGEGPGTRKTDTLSE